MSLKRRRGKGARDGRVSVGDGTGRIGKYPSLRHPVHGARLPGRGPEGRDIHEALRAANDLVSRAFRAPPVAFTQPVDPFAAPEGNGTTSEVQYGAALAGFAQLAATLGASQEALAAALAEDLADGALDGKRAGGEAVRVARTDGGEAGLGDDPAGDLRAAAQAIAAQLPGLSGPPPPPPPAAPDCGYGASCDPGTRCPKCQPPSGWGRGPDGIFWTFGWCMSCIQNIVGGGGHCETYNRLGGCGDDSAGPVDPIGF